MRDGLIITALSALPRHAASRWMGRAAQSTLSRHAIRLFCAVYQPDLSEVEQPLASFPTLQAFFRRPLRPGARPIADAPLTSPADGTLAATGLVSGGRYQQSEQHHGTVATLLSRAGDWEGWRYTTVYLSPRDYHRVHAPFSGEVVRLEHVAGERWPVFAAAVRQLRGLFDNNERLVIELDTGVVVLVGALGVSEIETALTVGRRVSAGDELGSFGFGSTVIVLSAAVPPVVEVGQPVVVGQPL